MRVYKFQDIVDGNYAFVAANSQEEAIEALSKKTAIRFISIESRDVNIPIVIMNNILPF